MEKALSRKKLQHQLRKVHHQLIACQADVIQDYEPSRKRQKTDLTAKKRARKSSTVDMVSLDSQPQLWVNFSKMEGCQMQTIQTNNQLLAASPKKGQFAVLELKN